MYAQLKRTSTTSPALSVDTKLQSGSADLVLKNKKDPKNVKLTVEKPLKAENKLEPSSSIAVTDNDIRDYAQSIGINPDTEPEFMKIAEQGFTQPLDPAWRAVPTDLGDCYFVHRLTGQATWEHPMDDHYREVVRKLRKSKDSSNQNSSTLLERPSSSGSDDHAVLSDAFSSDNELSSDSVTFGSSEACKSASPSSSSGAKKVTFRDELVEVREFDSPNKIQSPHRLDLFNQNTNTQHENNKLSETGFVQTEQCYRLIQIQRRSELIIQRNWRELCNALTESYSKSLQLSSAVASSSFEPLSSTTSN